MCYVHRDVDRSFGFSVWREGYFQGEEGQLSGS